MYYNKYYENFKCLKYFLFLIPSSIFAQDAMHIHSGASVQVSGNMTVFGNVQHDGDLSSQSTGVIRFFGTNWLQSTSSTHSGNGTLEMVQPNALYNTNFAQNIDGGGLSASIPNLVIDNASDVFLLNNDTKIRTALSFTQGHIFLEGNNLVVGDNSAGTINGFDENRFVVTNGVATDTRGFLIRESVGNAANIDFPVGISTSEYTPARLRNSGTADAFSVRVFSDVLADATIGANKNDFAVGRTWQIEEANTGGSNVEMFLQYTGTMEGVNYSHDKNFITRYVGQPNNVGGAQSLTDLPNWDNTGASGCNGGLQGNITTGTAQPTAWFSTRSGLTDFKQYVYYSPYACPETEITIPSAYSPNQDGINDKWEILNIQYFPTRSVKVVNRWGDVVFESKTYNNEWDGIFAGAPLPDGTYYYVLDLGDSIGIKKGPVTIVRD